MLAGYQLSPQQRYIWSLQEDGLVRCAQCAVLLEGRLNQEGLRVALERTIQRHDILRTNFHHLSELNVPLQFVADHVLLIWRSRDNTTEDLEQQIEQLFQEDQQCFENLSQAPLLRSTLLALSPNRHLLVLSLPALCADRWTLDHLVRQIGRAYQAYCQGKDDFRDRNIIQYIQFSQWQNEILEDENAKAGREFWLNQGAIPSLVKLPFERTPTDSKQTFEPAQFALSLDAPVLHQIKLTVQQYGFSLESCLRAVWQILLWRLMGQQDVVIYHLSHGRHHEELQNLFGSVAKWLPSRCPLEGYQSFETVLHQIDQVMQTVCEWQDYYDPRLIGKYSSGIGFEFIDGSSYQSWGGLYFSIYKSQICFERLKLKLVCTEKGNSLNAAFYFDPNCFDITYVQKLIGYFKVLLKAAIDHPTRAIRELDILDLCERQWLLKDLNDTTENFGKWYGVHQCFEAQVDRTPHQIAVSFENHHLSYAELNHQANHLANNLQNLSVAPDTPVVLFLERSPTLLVAILAIWKAGGAFVPLQPTDPFDRLARILTDLQAPTLITQQYLTPMLPEFAGHVLCLEDCEGQNNKHDSFPNPDSSRVCSPDQLAYLLYTSGSTGAPKGVMVSHRGLLNYLCWCSHAYELVQGQGALVHTSVGFDLTLTSLLAPLLVGQRVVLVPESTGIEELKAHLHQDADWSLVKLTPAHLDLLNQVLPKEAMKHCTRTLIVGGEALNSNSLALWQQADPTTRIVNEYGPTETVVGCCVYEVPREQKELGAIPIGCPIANMQLYVLDADLRPVPIGVPGELYIGGVGVARGYLHQPERTAECFIPHPFSDQPGQRLYRTGDWGRYQLDGTLEFLGRRDAQVKIRGFRIELGEIEMVLIQHPAIHSAAVIVRDDDPLDKRMVAYLVLQPATPDTPSLTQADLRQFLSHQLPDFMLPAQFVIVSSLPLTPNGKVDRRSLQDFDGTPIELGKPFVPPRTLTEEVLAGIWSQVLGIDAVSIHDSFFELGGDSIRSVQVIAKAKQRGFNFSIQQLFQHQTICQLAQAILTTESETLEISQNEEVFSLISEADRLKLPEAIEDAYPLTMLQAGMLYHMELMPNSPPYHNVNSYHLQGLLDPIALEEAIQQVVDRHAVLRTGFDFSRYSIPLQLVHQTAICPVQFEDLRHLSFQEQEEWLRVVIEREWRSPWDLSRPPLMRINVHQRSQDTFQFTVAECHAISDGWSTTSTFAEIFDRYFGILDGKPLLINQPPALSFRDFIALEQMALESQQCEQFWLQTLAGCRPLQMSQFASRDHRPQDAQPRRRVALIPPALAEAMGRLARSAAVPLKSVLLASHMKVLSLMSGQTDILTGIVANGRPEEIDGEQVRGLFLNTVPFRQLLLGGSWLDLIRETFVIERELLPFRRYPIAALQRNWGGHNLVEIPFTYLHFHSVSDVLGSGRLALLDQITRDLSYAHYSLQTLFQVDPVSNQLTQLWLEYDAIEWNESEIDAIEENYLQIMKAMAANPLDRYDYPHHWSHPLEQRLPRIAESAQFHAASLAPLQDFVLPRTPTEEVLATIWTEFLKTPVGVHNNFFELGGHSLLAAQLISRLSQMCQVDVSLGELLEHPTIAELAELIVTKQLEQSEQEMVAQLLAEIEALADEDVTRQLLDE